MNNRVALSEESLPGEPFSLFQQWLDYAKAATNLRDPNAMCVATVDEGGNPDSRMVLLKDFSPSGFVFYTNLNSPKGKDLIRSPRAALLFFWDPIGRQVRIQGSVTKVGDAEADEYFASRPRGSQIGAWASERSSVIPSRELLTEKVARFEKQFEGVTVPRPPHWSGFCVSPSRIQFWEERESRLHDRFLYERNAEKWKISRLSP